MYEVKLSPNIREIKYLGLVYDYIGRNYSSKITQKFEVCITGTRYKVTIEEELKDSKQCRKLVEDLGKEL